MDWIKIKDKHLFGWTLKEVGVIVKLQLLTARLERMPTPAEVAQEVPDATLKVVQDRLKGSATTLQAVLEKVLEDVQDILEHRLAGRQRKEKWRNKAKNKGAEREAETKGNEADKIREDKIREDNSSSTVLDFFQNNYYPLTAFLKERLLKMCEEFPPGWVIDALKVALDNGVRKLVYVQAILDRWKLEGKETEKEDSEWTKIFAQVRSKNSAKTSGSAVKS